MLDKLSDVPSSHDAAEERQGPSLLAARPFRPHRPQSIIGEEQVGLVPIAGDRPRQRARPRAALRVEFTEMGDGLLDDFAADADGTDELPIAMDLAVLPPRRVTKVHHSAYRASRPRKSM